MERRGSVSLSRMSVLNSSGGDGGGGNLLGGSSSSISNALMAIQEQHQHEYGSRSGSIEVASRRMSVMTAGGGSSEALAAAAAAAFAAAGGEMAGTMAMEGGLSRYDTSLVDEHEHLIRELQVRHTLFLSLSLPSLYRPPPPPPPPQKDEFATLHGSVDLINGRLNRLSNILEENAAEADLKMDTEMKKLVSNLNGFKSSMTTKLNMMQMGEIALCFA